MDVGKFQVDDLPYGIFSTRDLHILKTFGHRLSALASGTRQPKTPKEKRFVEDLRVRMFPGDEITESAVVWMRYQSYLELIGGSDRTTNRTNADLFDADDPPF